MRIFTLVLCVILCVISTFAKDVITKTDGTKIDAKVEEITESVIKYRKASNPTGPVYTIPISSVASVLYENGDTDKFNEITTLSTTSNTQIPTNTPDYNSDDELIQFSESQTSINDKKNISDNQLIQIYNESVGKVLPDEVKSKIKQYRTIGWVGGSLFFVAGAAGTLLMYFNESTYDYSALGACLGTLAGAGCFFIFNNKANSLKKKAIQMNYYSTTIIKGNILKFGNNSLTAGINVMGNRIINSHCIGVSLGLNF